MIIYVVETRRWGVFPRYAVNFGESLFPFCQCVKWLLRAKFLQIVCFQYLLGFFGSSASVDQVRPTDLQPFRVCSLTVSVFHVPLADHHGATNTILPWKTVPCHLLACASWRWKPTMPLTSTETCMSVVPYRALCFLCFLQQACNTPKECKMWSLAASESGIPMYSRGRRVGSCWSLLGSVSAVISRYKNIIKSVSWCWRQMLRCFPASLPPFNKLTASLSWNDLCSLWSWLSSVLNHLLFPFPQDCTIPKYLYIQQQLSHPPVKWQALVYWNAAVVWGLVQFRCKGRSLMLVLGPVLSKRCKAKELIEHV